MDWLLISDYAGVALFAATGALAASRKQLDVVGFVFMAALTGMGGGTLRDVVIGQGPVFWVQNPNFVLVSSCVGVVVYFAAHLVESRYKWLLWLDAIGLSAYSVFGAAKGFAASGSATVAIVTGMLTATAGGVLRDLVAGEPSVLIRPEIYVSAALLGAATFVGLGALGLSVPLASGLAFIAAFALRGGAIHFRWTMPVYKSRPGRNPDDLL